MFLMLALHIGIIGPKDLIDQIVKELNTYQLNNLEYHFFFIQQVEDTRTLNYEDLHQCDLLLFAGQMAHNIYLEQKKLERNQKNVPTIFIKYDESALYKTLYELAIEEKGSISSFTPFTIDVLHQDEGHHLLREIDLKDWVFINGLATYTTNQWATLHEEFYKQGKSKYAITCLTSVAEELVKRGIPVKRVMPTYSSIKTAIELLVVTSENLIRQKQQITAIYIEWIESERRPQNRYVIYRQKLKFESIIVDFCEQYGASLAFSDQNKATVYTTKAVAEAFTNHFHSFPLLQKLTEETSTQIFAGIGLGDETSTAEYSAAKALKFALVKGKSCAYVMFADGKMKGPLQGDNYIPLSFTTILKEEELSKIAQKAHLSAMTVSKLLSLIEQTKEPYVTAHTVAEGFNISLRSANRILTKLAEANLAEPCGEEQPPGRGRPRKIFRLCFLP